MSRLLLNLRHVPDDEVDEVRAMLDQNAITYYQTPPSRWGISYGGIWISSDDEMPRARRLMDDYQAARQSRVRSEHQAARRDGGEKTFMDVVREQPLRVLLTALAVLVLLALVGLPAFLLRP